MPINFHLCLYALFQNWKSEGVGSSSFLRPLLYYNLCNRFCSGILINEEKTRQFNIFKDGVMNCDELYIFLESIEEAAS